MSLSLSFSLCLQLLQGDYYSTKKQDEEEEKRRKKGDRIHRKKKKENASNNESNDERIRDKPLHVDVCMSMRVCVRVCVYILLSFALY